jgi:ribosome-associated toxin RatA of RatAB toxin-antitoxin module
MHTEDAIWMRALPDRVFALAADVARWPELLPHYRWVRVAEGKDDARVVEMAARRGPFPVRWTSFQWLYPESGRIVYRHIAGVTVGMEVEWRLTSQEGGTHVVIQHDLVPRHWLLRLPLAPRIAAGFFVKGIARRTLHHIKRAAERAASEPRELGQV